MSEGATATEVRPAITTTESRESEVKQAVNTAVSKIAVASTSTDAERFNTTNVDPLTNEEAVRLAKKGPDRLAYQAVADISQDSRSTVTISYEDWKAGLENYLNGQNTNHDALRTQRLEALIALGAIDNIDYKATVDNFFDTYLDGKSDIKKFISVLATLSTDRESGILNMNQLQQYVESIDPLLKVFGTKDNVNLAVRDFAIAHGVLSQPEEVKTNVVVEAVRDKITQPITDADPEKQYFDALYRKTKTAIQTPSPKPDATPPSEGAEAERRKNVSIRIGEATEIGNHAENEDSIWTSEELGVGIIADGMGGQEGGARASQLVVASLRESFEGLKDKPLFPTSRDAERWLKKQITLANKKLAEAKKATDNPVPQAAGTTLTLAYVWQGPNGESELITANVGDSRISVEINGKVGDLTLDHSGFRYPILKNPDGSFKYVQDTKGRTVLALDTDHPRTEQEQNALQAKFSRIKDPTIIKENDPDYLSQEEKALWDERNKLTAVIQGEDLTGKIDIETIRLTPGEHVRIFGRSDGSTDVMTDEETELILKQYDDPKKAADELVKASIKADNGPRAKTSGPDDKSIFVMEIEVPTTPGWHIDPGVLVQVGEKDIFIVRSSDQNTVYGTTFDKETQIETVPIRDFYKTIIDPYYEQFLKTYKEPPTTTPSPTPVDDSAPKKETASAIREIAQGMRGLVQELSPILEKQQQRDQEAAALLGLTFNPNGIPSSLGNLLRKQPDKSVKDILTAAGLPFAQLGVTFDRQGKQYVIRHVNQDQITFAETKETKQFTQQEFKQLLETAANNYFTLQELERTFRIYSPQLLINFVKRRYGSEYDAGTGVWEGYTLERHTQMLLGQYERYFAGKPLPEPMSEPLMRLTLALHDLGKPEAVRKGEKEKQHEYTRRYMDQALTTLKIPDEMKKLAIEVACNNFIGETIEHPDTLDKNVQGIQRAAAVVGIKPQAFFDILKIYYSVDAGSYTVDAGGKKSQDDKFIFDRKKGEMKFAPQTQAIIDGMQAALTAAEPVKDLPKLGPNPREFALYIRDHFTELQEKIDGPQGTLTELKRKLASREITVDPRIDAIISRVNPADLKEFNLTQEDLRAIIASFGDGQGRSALQGITFITSLNITPGQEMAKDGQGRDIRLSKDPKNKGQWIPPLGRFEGQNELRLYLPRLKETYTDERTRRIAALWVFAHEFTHSLVDTSHMKPGAQGKNIELPNGEKITTAQLFQEGIFPTFPELPISSRTASLRSSDGSLPTKQDDLFKVIAEEICETAAADILGFAERPDLAAYTAVLDPLADRPYFRQAVYDLLHAKKA